MFSLLLDLPQEQHILLLFVIDEFSSCNIFFPLLYHVCSQDNNNNPITTEFGLSLYEDQQTITIQEMPERAPPGQLPRSVGLTVISSHKYMSASRYPSISTFACIFLISIVSTLLFVRCHPDERSCGPCEGR